nr:molybdopterin-binding protein [Chloroflexus sp.]
MVLRPVDLGAIAAAGYATVTVRRRPRVAIIPTGTELITPEAAAARAAAGQPVQPGEIIEFNSLILAGLVEEWGGVPTRLPPVPDRQELLRVAVAEALANHDVIVINAGSSAGSEDYTAHRRVWRGGRAWRRDSPRPSGHPRRGRRQARLWFARLPRLGSIDGGTLPAPVALPAARTNAAGTAQGDGVY